MQDHLLILAGLSFNFSTLPEQLLNGILLGAIYALIALGYTMVYGVLKLINFAHGEVYMLGAYVALFGSYFLGFTNEATNPMIAIPAVVHGVATVGMVLLIGGLIAAVVGKVAKTWSGSAILFSAGLAAAFLGGAAFLIATVQPEAVDLFLMLIGSMVVCAVVGVLIERFAYRPMRRNSRIASLITAIGVSLLLQYGGALFLPNSPPPSIDEHIDPYRNAQVLNVFQGDPKLLQLAKDVEQPYKQAQSDYDIYMKAHPGVSQFSLPPEGDKIRNRMEDAKTKYEDLARRADNSGIKIHYQTGQVMILGATLVLMALLTYLVMYTKAGRAMRAVSHDFDSAALMGVNVNSIITFTFVLGSALAGAGSMMQASFLGTPMTTFYGLMPGVKAFVAAVLGGIGNIPGAVVGGLLMGIAETIATWTGGSEYRDAIAFIVLILVLMFKPGGLLGSSKVEKV
jgi:branched-chain amino acid transport system permease protein